jgi:predicted transcriptional regulator
MGQFQNNQITLNKGASERQINTASFNLNNQIDIDNSYLDVRHGKNTQQPPSMGARSRNNEVQFPSVKSTSRVLSNRSLIDLMSGVSTNSYMPRESSASYINNYPEKMKRIN